MDVVSGCGGRGVSEWMWEQGARMWEEAGGGGGGGGGVGGGVVVGGGEGLGD